MATNPTEITNPSNPTEGDDLGLGSINLLPSSLGATVFVEIIIIDKASGVANLPTNLTACAQDCDYYRGFKYTRDLFPLDFTKTVQSVLNWKGRKIADYTPYYRNYNTNALTDAGYKDTLRNRRSLVFIHTSLTDGQLATAMNHIGTHREILPDRMLK